MKAIAVLLFAAGVTTAATLPVHIDARELAIRQDVAAEVIDDSAEADAADAADAEAEDVGAEDAEAEDVNAEDAEAEDVEANDNEAEDVEDLDVADLDVDLNDIGDLAVQDLLNLNLNDAIDFNLLGLDPNLLALGITNLFDGFFPGFVTVDALGVLDAGQLLELMIVAQTVFNAQAFGIINQAQLVNLFATGFIGNSLPFGFSGQVPVNIAALGLGGGFGFGGGK